MQHSEKIEPGKPGKAGKPVDPLRAEAAARDGVQGQAMAVVGTDRVTSVSAIPAVKVDLKEEILRTALGKLSDEAAMKVILTVIEPHEMGSLLLKILQKEELQSLLRVMHEADETALKEALIVSKVMSPPDNSLDSLLQNAYMQHDGDGLVDKLGLDRLSSSVIVGMVQRLLEQYPTHQKLQLAHDLLKAS